MQALITSPQGFVSARDGSAECCHTWLLFIWIEWLEERRSEANPRMLLQVNPATPANMLSLTVSTAASVVHAISAQPGRKTEKVDRLALREQAGLLYEILPRLSDRGQGLIAGSNPRGDQFCHEG